MTMLLPSMTLVYILLISGFPYGITPIICCLLVPMLPTPSQNKRTLTMSRSSLMPKVIIIFAALPQQLSDRCYCIANIFGGLINHMLACCVWLPIAPPLERFSLFLSWLLPPSSIFMLLLFAPPLRLLHQNLVPVPFKR